MSDQHNREDGHLVPSGRRDLAPVTCANPLVSRGMADLAVVLQNNDPNDAFAYYHRGQACFQIGNYAKATKDFERVLLLLPKSSLCYYYRGYASCDDAIRFGIWLTVTDAFFAYNWARLRTTFSEEKLHAIVDAMRLCNRGYWKSRLALSDLARVYAEAGHFEEAERYQAMALELPRAGLFHNAGPTEDELRQRLEIYKERKLSNNAPSHELLRDKIRQALKRLTDRERELIAFRYGGNWVPYKMTILPTIPKLKEVSQAFGVTAERIKEIETQTVQHLREEGFGDQEPAILGKSVAELALPNYARRSLAELGCLSLGDLTLRTGDELLESKNFAIRWLYDVRNELLQFGLRLRGD